MNKYLNLIRSFFAGEFVVDQRMMALKRDRRIAVPQITNYIRISSLELAVQEIYENNVAGSVAELGVYKGEFSKYINRLFPDRTFYLFDTFEGFDQKDVAVDVANSHSSGTQDFSQTSVESVLAKMQHRDKCVVKQGWFPESLGGLEDRFAFVSLDADLYKPIYEGLEYFYPRLNRGGYIFVHDYNNGEYEGARKAVREFCKQHNIGYTPMTDSWGTAVIAK